jgi:alginate O-acetyltransferase complex protein AlgI
MVIGIIWVYVFAYINLNKMSGIIIAISIPLLTLIMFRYLSFILDILNIPSNKRDTFSFFLDVLLPAGISFYTFQMMAYVIDVRRGVLPPANLETIAMYISFFPQLIAGPIVRLKDMDWQFDNIKKGMVTPDFTNGMRYLAFGLFLKIMIADRIAGISGAFTSYNEFNIYDGLFMVLGYSFRIYLDFWSYSIMAIGLALFFGIKLPRNFKEPYLALNAREFWRRWHITLSFWLKDYVFIPLGGREKYLRNIIIIFLLCGLWHGAGYNFVIWGGYHALYVVFYHLNRSWWDRLPAFIQTTANFIIVSFSWPLFFLNLSQYADFISSFFAFNFSGNYLFGLSAWLTILLAAMWVFLIKEDIVLFDEKMSELKLMNTFKILCFNPALQGCMIATAVVFFPWSQTFIYFRF